MRFHHLNAILLALASTAVTQTQGAIVINEIADKGTSNACGGNDWIELFNAGVEDVDLGQAGYVLHDDKGLTSEDAFYFPPGTTLAADGYILLCTQQTIPPEDQTEAVGSVPDPVSPQFGISGDDTVTLVQLLGSNQARQAAGTAPTSYQVISQVVLPNTDDFFDVTYSLDPATGLYNYTSTPTPGAVNVMTAVLTPEERDQKFKDELKALNEQTTAFFNMDDKGERVADGFDDVLDLKFTMLEDDYAYMLENRTFEQYRPFQSASLQSLDGNELAAIKEEGKIRPKGQSSLFLATCLGVDTFPFQVKTASNETFFGMSRFYLRHHFGDFSFMRDYAYNRMLARFGMPFVKTRKVRVYINDNLHGFYSMMEAPDQDYVFARSFPDFDPNRYALFKIKSFSLDCGSYSHDEIEEAMLRIDEPNTPPYSFQRGDHKPAVEQLGEFALSECIENYDTDYWERDYQDTILAWLRHDRSCSEMIMKEGLIDRDLGTKQFDNDMEDFITSDFSDETKCTEECANSNLKNEVDSENWLKAFAFYAVTMNADSPLINLNNYYLAQSGDDKGWKIVPYDFNLAAVYDCADDVCNERLAHWSIARPTCTSLEHNNLAGPLLTDEVLHAQYLEYVREFVDTIYGNETFVKELEEHAKAQDEFVRADYWSAWAAFYDQELTPESANWQEVVPNHPLLPIMKARTEDVRAQLAAIDAGEFPRGPFVGINGDNDPWEPCPDWRTSEANRTTCEQACMYEGCHVEGWTVPSFCDEETGKCLHGDYDEQCRGIYDDAQYPGMQKTADGRDTFCRFTAGIPVKAAECPAVGAIKDPSLQAATSGAIARAASIIAMVMSSLIGFFLG